MFDNKKITTLKNQVNSDIKSNNTPTTPQLNREIFPVKITASSLSSGVYLYNWQAVKVDGQNDPYKGSGDNTKHTHALAACEFGVNMTNKPPTYAVNEIVMLQKGKTGHIILGRTGSGNTANILDLTDSSNDIKGWESGRETTNNSITGQIDTGLKVKSLERLEYNYTDDLNYEYYRVLHFSSGGILFKVEQVVKVNGFETTLHDHA